MDNNEHIVKTVGLPLSAIAVPPGAARNGKVLPSKKESLQSDNSANTTPQKPAAANMAQIDSDISSTATVSRIGAGTSSSLTARKATPRLRLSGSKSRQIDAQTPSQTESIKQVTVSETAMTPAVETTDNPPTTLIATPEVKAVKASSARPKLSLKGAKNPSKSDSESTSVTDISVPDPSTEPVPTAASTENIEEISSHSTSVESIGEKNLAKAQIVDIPAAKSDVSDEKSTDITVADGIEKDLTSTSDTSLEVGIEKSADTTHITHFMQRHGSPTWAVLQPIGRAGVRITLIAEDGILGDQVVANLEIAQNIISRLSDIEISDWNRELNAKTTISPQHWRKMAGWVAKSHHFPKFKSRSA